MGWNPDTDGRSWVCFLSRASHLLEGLNPQSTLTVLVERGGEAKDYTIRVTRVVDFTGVGTIPLHPRMISQ